MFVIGLYQMRTLYKDFHHTTPWSVIAVSSLICLIFQVFCNLVNFLEFDLRLA